MLQDVGKGANPETMRRTNRELVIEYIRQQGPASRVALSRALRLSSATLCNITGELITEGFLRESGVATARLGRKPTLLQLNSEWRFAVGVDLEEVHSMKVGLFDLHANCQARVDVRLKTTSPGAIVNIISEAVNYVLRQRGIDYDRVAGVGVVTPGVLDPERTTVISSFNLGWRNVPFRDLLAERLGLPLILEMVDFAPAVAERRYGVGKGIENFVYVTVGPGLGACFVIHGELYQGGEFGHTIIDVDGPLCQCGNRGCLEAFVSERALIEKATQALARGEPTILASQGENGASLSLESLFEAAKAGDQVATSIIMTAGQYLSIGIINLVHLFKPGIVILGGDAIEVGDLLLEQINKAMREDWLCSSSSGTQVVLSPLGKDAGMIGAATLVLDRLFHSRPGS